MKKVVLCSIICILFLCGCASISIQQAGESSNAIYDIGYTDGYRDGYEDAFEKSLNNPDCSEELRSFQSAVADLMYDREYDIIKKLMDYNPKGVQTALEIEFGTNNIDAVINYLDELSKTITGTCEICGELVYADDFAILPEGINCAHSECV